MSAIISPQMTKLNFSQLKNGKWLEIFTTSHKRSILMHILGSGKRPIVDIKRVVHGTTEGPPMVLLGCIDTEGEFHHEILRVSTRVMVSGIKQNSPVALTGLISGWKVTNKRP